MLHLLTRPHSGRNVRRLIGAMSAVLRSVVAPPSPMRAPAPAAPESARLCELDEIPAAEDIEAAAVAYSRAVDQARAGDRGKRAARKVLDRLPAGRYGAWLVSRVPSSRQTVDLDEVRRIFKAHGLGPVPMKASAPSLKVEPVAAEQLVPAAA